jgi:predicted Zn finger-like uncharacterized protein
VLIRCEKCSTLYELDDKVLPPQGAPVQCSKCQFVFKAYPAPPEPARQPEPPLEEAPEPEPLPPEPPPEPAVGQGVAVADEDVPPTPSERRGRLDREAEADGAERLAESRRASSSYVVREGGALAESGSGSLDGGGSRVAFPVSRAAGASPGSSPHAGTRSGSPGSGEQQFTADGRPIRKVPFPVSEPSPPLGGRPPGPTVSGKRTSGAGPARMIPMVAVVGLVILVIVAVIAWALLRGRAGSGSEAQPGRAVPAEGAAVSRPAPPAGTPATAPGK